MSTILEQKKGSTAYAVLNEEKSNYEKEKTYCLCSSNTIHGNFENNVMVK